MPNDALKCRLNLFVDVDAAALLDTMATERTRGAFVSDLIRSIAEQRARVEKAQRSLAQAAQAVAEIAEQSK